jgi:hypothetical protein
MRTKQNTTVLALLTVCLAAEAELRTWIDINGHKVTAELIENMHGNVTLRTEKEKEIHISISGLSAADQKYVLKNSPPKIDIRVSEVTNRKNKGFSFENPNNSSNDRDVQVQTTSSHYKVTLEKSGSRPYNRSIQAELYIIGFKKLTEEFVLLSKTVEDVDFNQEDSENKFVFNSNTITTRNLQGGVDAGTEYFGYLVVLVDEKNHVFDVKGSRSKIEEHTATLRKRKSGDAVKKSDLASADNRTK